MSKSKNSIDYRKNSDLVIHTNKIVPQKNVQRQISSDSKFKRKFDDIKSARDPRTRKMSHQISTIQPSSSLRSSTSKFSQRHKHIVSSRNNIFKIDFIENFNKQPEQKNGKKIQSNLNLQSAFAGEFNDNNFSKEILQLKKKSRHLQKQRVTDSNHVVRMQKDIEYVELPKLSINQLIIRKQNQDKDNKEKQAKSQNALQQQKQKQLTGYWMKQNKFVSLTMLQKNQRLDFNHNKILPIYAQITIQNIRYVVSDQYKNFSLKNLIEQFGPLEENIAKRYLKQIAQGLQHMHYHKCGHNRLTTRSVLYNKGGNIFINAINATSLLLSKKQIDSNPQLHYYSPQFLLDRSLSTKSLKNDIWSLGCIALEMFGMNIFSSRYHPYNFKAFEEKNKQTMIDNVKQICKKYFAQNDQRPPLKRNSKRPQIVLSQTAINFIQKCFEIITDRRQTIEQLLEHQFLEGF